MNLNSILVEKIKESDIERINIMEVCGTHTSTIESNGIRKLLYPKVRLISGPGCPVCVTSIAYIDSAIDIVDKHNAILCTFGDLIRVKGSSKSLMDKKEEGKNIKILYSPLDVIKIAEEYKDSEVVFLAVGFETTAPIIGLVINECYKRKIKNISFLCELKSMEPIIRMILNKKNHNINGIICPGHVASIVGSEYFKFITEEYNIPAAVVGFEALDILGAIDFLIDCNLKDVRFNNLYKSCVTLEGNLRAQSIIKEIFTRGETYWRGIGKIENSGFFIKEKYRSYDAVKKFNLSIDYKNLKETCICSEIILGNKEPNQCNMFKKYCTPENPLGPCMVSREGSCLISYKYS
ncbi:hydrogenase formation protein HypD [Hathewaya massiliensis]|uniref:hydrogenase formation protein HypD n=1 Tax=Hathewaya massiliensis TaxID=1964382 RepID=UPI00115A9C49|nr:hydrogenase formation protein HypD [Hathewaya massiliensis]